MEKLLTSKKINRVIKASQVTVITEQDFLCHLFFLTHFEIQRDRRLVVSDLESVTKSFRFKFSCVEVESRQ